MSQTGTYYLGRIIKSGLLDKDKVIEALQHPKQINSGSYCWTITSFQKLNITSEEVYFGKLSKFEIQGNIKVLDRENSAEKEKLENDLIKASSSFVYLPEYSGFAYLHVWNEIEQKTFVKHICSLIKNKYDNFFVDCNIEAISELESFQKKILEMSEINFIKAKVNPPNPLFGHLWKSLKENLEKRNTDNLTIEEKSNTQIQSDLPKLINNLISKENTLKEIAPEIIDLADAAILMALDGYGEGRIEGKINNKKFIIRTNDKIINFKMERNPEPITLYNEAKKIFEKISKERKMEH